MIIHTLEYHAAIRMNEIEVDQMPYRDVYVVLFNKKYR